MQPIKMNDSLIRDVLQEFYAQASALGNLQTDKFSFNKNFSKSAFLGSLIPDFLIISVV